MERPGLLADPLPLPMGGATPPIEINNGTVELAGTEEEPGTAVLRDVSIRIPPETAASSPSR